MFVVDINDNIENLEYGTNIIKNVKKDYQKFCTEEGAESVVNEICSANKDFKIKEQNTDEFFRSFGRFKF